MAFRSLLPVRRLLMQVFNRHLLSLLGHPGLSQKPPRHPWLFPASRGSMRVLCRILLLLTHRSLALWPRVWLTQSPRRAGLANLFQSSARFLDSRFAGARGVLFHSPGGSVEARAAMVRRRNHAALPSPLSRRL